MSSSETNPIAWLLGGGGLVALGGGVKWLWDKISNARATRERKIEAREDGYVKKIEARLAQVESMLTAQAREIERHRLSIALLVAEVARTHPTAPVLAQVERILGDAFPLHIGIPPDMQASLDAMHDGDTPA